MVINILLAILFTFVVLVVTYIWFRPYLECVLALVIIAIAVPIAIIAGIFESLKK